MDMHPCKHARLDRFQVSRVVKSTTTSVSKPLQKSPEIQNGSYLPAHTLL